MRFAIPLIRSRSKKSLLPQGVLAIGFLLLVAVLVAWYDRSVVSRAQSLMRDSTPARAQSQASRLFKEGKYLGSDKCAECHAAIAATQHDTAMGHALETVAESRVLKSHPRLTFRIGNYSYQILRQGDRSIYSVTDGINTLSEPIFYSFGQGKAGQTYVLRRGDSYYESRVSYYKEIDGLDITLGYPRSAPSSLADALGREISLDETRSCFGCHSTAAVSGKNLQLKQLIPGVRCEACHGPGEQHVIAMNAKKVDDSRIFNPGKLSPDDLSQEFCGSCHRSAEQVIEMNLLNINNLRFQPYRSFTGRGHDPNDERLSCTGCHDPHANPEAKSVSYDANCLSCHQSQASLKSVALAKSEQAKGRAAKACPVARQNCVTCHMPKIEIPGSHFKFTDHRIRISRPGEPFPT
jgi:predicted CXXCH cytochrome family protein